VAPSFPAAAFLFALGALTPGDVLADAFFEKPGGGKVIAGGMFEVGGGPAPIAAYRKFALSKHAEYGLSDSTTLLARTESGALWLGERDTRGAGSIGMRRLLYDAGAMRAAAQAMASVDAGLDRLSQGGRGSGLALDARLAAVTTFNAAHAPAFFMVAAGVRVAEREAIGGRFEATLGVRPFASLLLLAQMFGRFDEDPLRDRRVATIRAQASVISDLTPEWSVQAGVFAGLPNRSGRRERGLLAAAIRRF
jgi:hypothetical protein